MNKCVICDKECVATCCSGACRAKKSRRTVDAHVTERTVTKSVINIESLTASQLYLAVNNYRQDTWKDSAEFKELLRRLHGSTVTQLESQGFHVPAWKHESERAA